jgi:glycosyltransferase involved in cell wall biosynthesis
MKKKLLFIIYTHSLGGGAEKILTNIVNGLDPDKYEIDILEYAQYGVKEEPIKEHVRRLKPIVSMKNDGKIKRVWKNIQVYSYAKFLRKREKKYDLEISFNYLIPTFLLSKDVPTIAWIHGDVSDLKEKTYYRMLQRNSLRHINQIVTISQNSKQAILDVFPEVRGKLNIIYNGFDVVEIQENSNRECDISLKQPSITYIGRLENGKNPLVLLDVLKKLKEEGEVVNLYYVGQGEMQDSIIERVQEYGLQEQVQLLGYQQNPYPVMRQSTAICMMSHSEGFPTVFAEGMALGTPFISTPVGGVVEMANGGTCGHIVNNVDECVHAIEKCVLNEKKNQEMQKACKEHIHLFDLATQIQKIEKLFDDTMNGNVKTVR